MSYTIEDKANEFLILSDNYKQQKKLFEGKKNEIEGLLNRLSHYKLLLKLILTSNALTKKTALRQNLLNKFSPKRRVPLMSPQEETKLELIHHLSCFDVDWYKS